MGPLLSNPLAAAVDLPDMGSPARAALSPEEEKRLGDAFMRNIRQSLTIVDDPEVSEYIQSLGYRLVENIDHPEFNFEFFVVDDPQINAFAGPGGHVGVNSGLILATQTESELAAVLAHEISHVTQHHIARAIEDAQKSRLPMAAGLLAAILLGIQNPQMGAAALTATEAGSIQHQITFTRAHEEEADRIGIGLLARAGFNPMAMADFFERLQKLTRLSEDNIPAFLQDHPVTQDRIAEARGRARQLMADMTFKPDPDTFNYLLIRAKLRVLTTSDANKSIAYFESKLQAEGGVDAVAGVKGGLDTNRTADVAVPQPASGVGGTVHEADEYGYAEALLNAGQYARARPVMHRLLADNPNKIAYLIAAANLDMGEGHGKAALQIFTDALKLYPHSHALIVSYVHALLQSGLPRQATQLLQEHMRTQTPSPDLYGLLARAQGQAGDAIEAHQSLAEYYYLSGQTSTAIEQLNIALSMSREQDDPFQTSRIKARLEQLEQEQKAESQ